MSGDRFKLWLTAVDRLLADVGLSMSDLPDAPFRDWFEAGLRPKGAVSRLLKLAVE